MCKAKVQSSENREWTMLKNIYHCECLQRSFLGGGAYVQELCPHVVPSARCVKNTAYKGVRLR